MICTCGAKMVFKYSESFNGDGLQCADNYTCPDCGRRDGMVYECEGESSEPVTRTLCPVCWGNSFANQRYCYCCGGLGYVEGEE